MKKMTANNKLKETSRKMCYVCGTRDGAIHYKILVCEKGFPKWAVRSFLCLNCSLEADENTDEMLMKIVEKQMVEKKSKD